MNTTLPHNFPHLMTEANRLADELLVGLGMELCPRDALVRSQARLLADLTRRESQAFWLRALANRKNLPLPKVGVPAWSRRPGGFYLATPFGGMPFIDYHMNAMEAGYRIAGIGFIPDTTEGDAKGLGLTLHAVFGVPL